MIQLRSVFMPLAVLVVASFVQLNGGLGVRSPSVVEPYSDRLKFAFLIAFKRYQYAWLAVFEGINIALGYSQPNVSFQVLKDPPSIFINWELLPDKRDELVALVGLPNWLQMKPVSVIEGEEPRYFLSCNIYEVSGLSGLLRGFRAEWSIYVGGDDSALSFLVIEARHSELSQDSVNGFVLGTALEHSRENDTVPSFVQFDKDTSFRTVIAGLGDDAVPKVLLSREWIAANDFIYWKNGVADRTHYDGSMVNEKLLSVDPSRVSIEDSTYLASFVKTNEPASVLVFPNEISLVVSPWYNLDKPKRGRV